MEVALEVEYEVLEVEHAMSCNFQGFTCKFQGRFQFGVKSYICQG